MEVNLLLPADSLEDGEVVMDDLVMIVLTREYSLVFPDFLLDLQDFVTLTLVHLDDSLVEADCACSVHGTSCCVGTFFRN